MAKGSTHAKATLALAAVGGWVSYRLGHPLPFTLALTGGVLAGLAITPDLDLERGCISNAVIRRLVGRTVERLWGLFWRPYGLLLRHRSRLSHLPVVGTTVRLVYLCALPALICWLAGNALGWTLIPSWIWWSIAGLILADSPHFLMDSL